MYILSFSSYKNRLRQLLMLSFVSVNIHFSCLYRNVLNNNGLNRQKLNFIECKKKKNKKTRHLEVGQATIDMVAPWCHSRQLSFCSTILSISLQGYFKVQDGCNSSSHHMSISGSQKQEERVKGLPIFFVCLFLEIQTVLLLTFHWSEISYTFIPSCRGGWEISSYCFSVSNVNI